MFEPESFTLAIMGSFGILAAILIDVFVRQVRIMLPRPCRLIRAFFAPDTCAGACPPGTSCRVVRTRRYLLFLRQAADCACVLIPPGGGGGGVPGGGGAGQPGGQ